MPDETTEKPKTAKVKGKRGPRANYQRDLERVGTYLETIIRIKTADLAICIDDSPAKHYMSAQLAAYRDVLDFMGER